MSNPPPPENEPPRAGSLRVTLLACAVLGAAAGGITLLVYSTQPVAQRTTETRQSAMLVEVVTAERGAARPRIAAMGIVRPAREIMLSPRVRGEVVARAPAFDPGGILRAGESLLKIDPADYRNALAQRRSELNRANADLEIEMGRQKIARLDFELLDDSLADANRDLALRRPQLLSAQAAVELARTAVEQAELDLARCEIAAPFDVQVIERNVDVGSQVAPGDDLGGLVGLDTYWVVVTVPLSSLAWIDVPASANETGSSVRLRNRAAWPAGATRDGVVTRLVGSLDERTRLARLLVTVEDPLARDPAVPPGTPPLVIGSVLEAVVEGREIPDVVRLDRALLRENDTVWVNEDGGLRIVPVEVVFRDADHVFIRNGLESGDVVVTTNLSSIADGAPLRVKGGDPP